MTLYARNATHWVEKDGHSRGKQRYKRNSAAASVKMAQSIFSLMNRKRKRRGCMRRE